MIIAFILMTYLNKCVIQGCYCEDKLDTSHFQGVENFYEPLTLAIWNFQQ